MDSTYSGKRHDHQILQTLKSQSLTSFFLPASYEHDAADRQRERENKK